jgi:molybdenum cofactor cytidylyltransferase
MVTNVFALVLAAGSSSRFGSTKQLTELNGISLITRAVRTANDVCGDNSVVVIGHDAAAVANEISTMQGFVIVNDHYSEGLGTSLARGVAAIRHVASAVVVMLADQPGITTRHVADLVNKWNGDSNQIVATTFADTNGPPVLFPAGCFEDLQALRGDAGGKHLFDDPRFELMTVAFEAAAVDIDRPADLKQI